MSRLEKLIIPLLDGNITPMDLTAAAGFIDSYTYDPDRPSGEKVLFLVYDDRIRNDYVTDRARRFDSMSILKRKYVKIVDHIPYYVYVFWIKPSIKISEKGSITLTGHQKISVLQFWGFPDDLVDLLVDSSSIVGEYIHEMPLEDYYPDEYVEEGLTIIKKGAAS
jgi:hypothetical protein